MTQEEIQTIQRIILKSHPSGNVALMSQEAIAKRLVCEEILTNFNKFAINQEVVDDRKLQPEDTES